MDNASQQPSLPAQVRTGQIIIGAMVMGVSTFLAIVFVLRGQQQRPVAASPMLSYVVLPVMTLTCIAAAIVVPRVMTAATRKRIAEEAPPSLSAGGVVAGKLAGVYLTQMIVAAALVEGPAFFATICYLLEGNAVAPGVAIVLIAALATLFPTRPGVEQWIDRQLEQAEQDRQMIT